MIDPETLIEWSLSGKSKFDSNAYNRFTKVISSCFPKTIDIFLQGSYANSTGVYGNSDVDIVAICKGYYIDSPYTYADLKRLKYDMYESIKRHSTFKLIMGKKTIKYKGSPKYSPVDILPCIPHISNKGELGITFYDYSRKVPIYNYPKQHIKNGIEKNKRTGESFKRTVRVFKCARNLLLEEGVIKEKSAPSYFVECLLYNVPDKCFDIDVIRGFNAVRHWLNENQFRIEQMTCQNGIQNMFNNYSGWNARDCINYINAINDL